MSSTESKAGEEAQASPSGGAAAVDPELAALLERFGRGSESGTASDAALQQALDELAEHQTQVDLMVQQEQEQAEAVAGDRTGGLEDAEGGGSDGGSAAAGIEGGAEGDQGGLGSATGSDAEARGESTLRGDRPSNDVAYPPPPDVGDGSDDDVLAAQLRELATQEEDPELRERYWEAYRKHKGID